MTNCLPAALLLLCMPLLNGCGQKGPLYLPEPEKQDAPEQQAESTDETEQQQN